MKRRSFFSIVAAAAVVPKMLFGAAQPNSHCQPSACDLLWPNRQRPDWADLLGSDVRHPGWYRVHLPGVDPPLYINKTLLHDRRWLSAHMTVDTLLVETEYKDRFFPPTVWDSDTYIGELRWTRT